MEEEGELLSACLITELQLEFNLLLTLIHQIHEHAGWGGEGGSRLAGCNVATTDVIISGNYHLGQGGIIWLV